MPVFRSLIAYLRAAMPQLHQDAPATLGDEERLVRAYLELMLMRMPDRLTFTVAIDPALRTLAFPQMGLLTLVENAVRHGIDPSCDPGRIDVGARRGAAGALQLWVADTGLRNLRQRLQAFFGPDAVELFDEHQPQVVFLDVHMPGLNGVEVACCIDRRAEVVFVTAFDRYAVEAVRHGAVDYLASRSK